MCKFGDKKFSFVGQISVALSVRRKNYIRRNTFHYSALRWLEDGSVLEYANVGESIWRNFKMPARRGATSATILKKNTPPNAPLPSQAAMAKTRWMIYLIETIHQDTA